MFQRKVDTHTQIMSLDITLVAERVQRDDDSVDEKEASSQFFTPGDVITRFVMKLKVGDN